MTENVIKTNETHGVKEKFLDNSKKTILALQHLIAMFGATVLVPILIGVFLNTIPTPVMGGISLMLFSMISLIGVKTIKTSNVKFNIKNILIMGSILVLGLGSGIIESKFGITVGIPINETVKITGLSFAAIVGIILNIILNSKGKN